MLQDSFAVYTSDKCDLDVHINIWTNMYDINYIDIGFRIYKEDSFDWLSIYLPYPITKSDIFDLSENLKDEKTMRGIFNKNCSITISSTNNAYDVKFDEYCMKVIPAEKYNLEMIGSGTILTFPIFEWSDDNISYIRFRLPYKSLSHYLLHKKHRYLEALESPIMKDRLLYNFKLNEKRTLPKDLLAKSINLATVKSIKIFVCVPEKYQVGTDNIYKARIVENNVFEKYIPDKLFEKNSVVYQWNYGNSKRYTLSTFFERKYINWLSILVYSSAIIVLNIISNMIFTSQGWELLGSCLRKMLIQLFS